MTKKKVLSILACFCLVILGGFSLAGCGEQFIEEKTYQLVNMQVIKDETPNDGSYSHFDDGEFSDSFTGGMRISQSKVEVGRKSSTLIFDDSQNTGFVVSYVFDVYTGADVYPAYSFTSYKIMLNDVDVSTLSESEIQAFSPEVKNLYEDILQFTNVLSYGETSIQLITQNKAFACNIVMIDNEGKLYFMATLYGF